MCSTTLEALTLHFVGVKSERMENGGKEQGEKNVIFHCLIGVKRERK